MKIDGRNIASEILLSIKPKIEQLKSSGIIPTLAIILIGDDPSSKNYIKQKQIKAFEIGINTKLFHFKNCSEQELTGLIDKLNSEPNIHGIIIQRPLPNNINSDNISRFIKPEKDVDGFNDESQFDAPVALAVIEILKRIGINELENKKITVLGKGETAGLPIIKLLDKMELNFEVIDSKTKNTDDILRKSEIIISAVGKANILKPDILNKNQIIIGVGLFNESGKLKGDYDVEKIKEKVKFYTPTIGGVGPVNVALLLKNLLKAARN